MRRSQRPRLLALANRRYMGWTPAFKLYIKLQMTVAPNAGGHLRCGFTSLNHVFTHCFSCFMLELSI